MKYTIHRFTAVILMFAAVLFCFPQSALAETYTFDKYSGQYSDGTYEYSVKYNESEQTYLVRIDSVINKNALSGDIVIPGTLQMSDGTALAVTEIGGRAFSDCYMIESVTIPNGVTYIWDYAFFCCHSLAYVTIPGSVDYIGEYAFFKCDLLTVTIPSGVTFIGPFAFSNCEELAAINVSANNGKYSSENGILFNKDKTALIKYPMGKTETEYAIPESVTTIGEYAFYECKALESVTIPNSVTNIGENAFAYCGYLKSVIIPDSVTNIGEYVFCFCSSLEFVEIPDSVTAIGEDAFCYCNSLETVIIPDSVTYIGEYAFSNCGSLTKITVPDSVTDMGEYVFDYSYGLTDIVIPVKFRNHELGNLSDYTAVHYICKVKYTLKEQNKLTELGVFDVDYGEKLPEYSDLPNPGRGYRYIYYNQSNNSRLELPYTVTGDIDVLMQVGKYYFNVTIDSYNGKSQKSVLADSRISEIITEDSGYDYTYKMNDRVCDKNVRITSDCTITVRRTLRKYTVAFIGDITDTQTVVHGGKANVSEEKGYTYTYTVNGEAWDPNTPITSDLTVTVTKTIKTYTVTFIGDITDTQNVTHGGKARVNEEYGYTYTYTVGGEAWNPNTPITSDLTVMVKKTIKTYNVAFIGDITDTQIVAHGGKASVNEEDGYIYTYSVDGWKWNPNAPITSDLTVTVTKTIKTYTVTFVGDITDTQPVAHGGKVHVNEKYGYTYTYTVNGEAWDPDTPITSDLTVTVTKTIKTYTVTFIGDITDTQNVTYGGRASVSEEDGYIYTYTVDGVTWNPNRLITSDLTVTVTKTIKTYTVTFVGDWNNTEVVNHGDTVKDLADPDETCIYEYRTGSKYGKIWDTKTPIKSDLTVYVTKVITAYRVTFYGDWECTQIVDKNACVERLPQAEDGYVYVYSVKGMIWNPNRPITSDITVKVEKCEDITKVTGIYGCDDISIDNENRVITATVYNKTLLLKPILLGNKARAEVKIGYRVVYNTGSDENTKTELDYGENEYTLTVWAESGRTAEYKLKLNLEKLSDIGYMTALTYGRTIGFKPAQRIKGNPIIKVRYSTNTNFWTYIDAEYNSDVNMIYVKNLASKTTYYFMIEADYGYEKYVCNTNTPIMAKTGLSDECLLIRTKNPPSTDIDHENGTVSGLWVQNVFDICIVDVDVSDGATWEMFLTPDMNIPSEDREVSLKEGKTTNVYIRVTAEDGISSKIYTLPIYRWTKSEKPRVGVTDGLVSMTAREGSVIYYTTDNSYPTPGSKNTMIYTGPFLCADRTNVKAIAKDADRDEASDPVGYEVRGAARTAMTSAAFSAAAENEYSYEISLETLEASGLNGILYIAAYDKDGVLTALEKVTVSTANRKYLASGKFYTVQKPERYAAFFLDSYMKPIARMRSI